MTMRKLIFFAVASYLWRKFSASATSAGSRVPFRR
jgi:hypothetical protein